MGTLTVENVYGASTGGVAYKEETGELFLAVERQVKRVAIRSSSSTVLSLVTEAKIRSISVEKDLMLVLDVAGRVYLHSIYYNVEIGRMNVKSCLSAVLKDKKMYLEYEGYMQEWVPESNGFFSFKKTKHITGHKDNITMISSTEGGVLTGSRDGVLRIYEMEGEKSKFITGGRTQPISAKKIENEIVSVFENGEIRRVHKENDEWIVSAKVFTNMNFISADISKLGDIAVGIDSSHYIYLFNTQSPEPVQKIFVSDKITSAIFIEQDEWIVLSGGGSVIWEWRTNTLLFNEQNTQSQRVLEECSGSIISGGENGEIFIWDSLSSLCIKKIQAHTSPVVAVLPKERGFLSVSQTGQCVFHGQEGEVKRIINTEIAVSAADADEDFLIVSGIGEVKVYDIRRGKSILEKEIGIPLCTKIIKTHIFVISNNGILKFTDSFYLQKDAPEALTAGCIVETRTGTQVICLGESGMVYIYTEMLEEVSEHRVLPKYVNGLGNCSPLTISAARDGSILVTYEVERPDRHKQRRKSLCASIYVEGYETDRWIVLEDAAEKEVGYAKLSYTSFGHKAHICTKNGIFVFSDRAGGFKPSSLWQKETPEEIEEQIEKGDALSGAIAACKMQNLKLMKKAVEKGEASLLAAYFPIEMAEYLFPMLLSLLSEGIVEKPLEILGKVLRRVPSPPLLRQQLLRLLSPVIDTSNRTGGYIDALIEYPYLLEK